MRKSGKRNKTRPWSSPAGRGPGAFRYTQTGGSAVTRLKHILKTLFCLPPLPTLLISVPSLVLVFFILGLQIDGWPAYLAYGLSAYGLVILTTGLPGVLRATRARVERFPPMRWLRRHPLGGRYLSDAAFRAEVSLYPSLCFNLLYAGVKLASGVYYRSPWFISLGVYYALLAVMQFLLLTSTRKTRRRSDLAEELRRYRTCGGLLACMTLALSGVILYIVRQDAQYSYPGALIYAMALYAFYAVISAVVSLVRFRRRGSPVLSAAKAVKLAAALMSMLALQTAMLDRFSGPDAHLFRQGMTIGAGAVVCGLVLGMAAYMTVRGARQLKRLTAGPD